MMDSLNHLGVRVIHAWGMTELSPLGTFATLTGADLKKPISEQNRILQKQGRALFGIEMKIVNEDGLELVQDGVTFGNLMVKGSCVINNYFRVEESPLIDGWFPTGDVATIDAAGNMQITDRTKDVIKSGGEWISSIDIENIASAHPDLLAVACIAIAHPKWQERPLLVAVKKPNYIRSEQLLKEEIWQLFQGKMAKWCVPDEIIFIEEIRTCTKECYYIIGRNKLLKFFNKLSLLIFILTNLLLYEIKLVFNIFFYYTLITHLYL
jgi:fatty-acyl-CoA synthase